MRKPHDSKRLVTVCASCLRAYCWHGKFYCDDAKNAGTTELTVSMLRKLNKELPAYYSVGVVTEVCGPNHRYLA